MRRLTYRDAVPTVLVAAIVVPYIGYLIWGNMPFIEDARGMAAVGLVGLVLCFIAWGVGVHSTFGKVLFGGGLVSLGLGFSALLIGAEGNHTLLAVFVASIVAIWAAETFFKKEQHEPASA